MAWIPIGAAALSALPEIIRVIKGKGDDDIVGGIQIFDNYRGNGFAGEGFAGEGKYRRSKSRRSKSRSRKSKGRGDDDLLKTIGKKLRKPPINKRLMSQARKIEQRIGISKVPGLGAKRAYEYLKMKDDAAKEKQMKKMEADEKLDRDFIDDRYSRDIPDYVEYRGKGKSVKFRRSKSVKFRRSKSKRRESEFVKGSQAAKKKMAYLRSLRK